VPFAFALVLGLRLYLIATPAGMPVTWALADPKLDERTVLAAMLDLEPELAAARPGLVLIADKGFKARWFETSLDRRGIELLRPAMRNEPPARRGARLPRSHCGIILTRPWWAATSSPLSLAALRSSRAIRGTSQPWDSRH
jgi:hypothetical protein